MLIIVLTPKGLIMLSPPLSQPLSPRLQAVSCLSPAGLHRMAYQEWGDPHNSELVLCVHGLTRTGRDFDALAQTLSSRFRVVCPDVVGRGLSDWLAQPGFYAVGQYAADMVTLIAHLRPTRLHWVGTSMGGLIGLVYAGLLAQSRMEKSQVPPAQQHLGLPETDIRLDSLTLNDVGPHIEPVSLQRIGEYVGQAVSFTNFDQAVSYVQTTCAPFGPHTPLQWEALTRDVYIESQGKWIKHYDLSLAQAFKQMTPELAAQGEALLWGAFASIRAPIQIIRGQLSDLLSEQTCEKMLQIQPQARLAQISGVGHAPTLMSPEQIAIVSDFLLGHCDPSAQQARV